MTMSKNGFTLIELIVVIAIIGMASALALPLISNSFDRLRLNSASRQFAGLLRSARSHAISEKKKREFRFDFNTREYSVTTETPDALLTVDHGKIPENVILTGFSYTGYNDLEKEGAFTVSFFPQGNSTGGSIYLGATDYGEGFSITVDRISGRVRIGTVEKK